MEEEVTLEHEGKTYSASYIAFDDEILVLLPDGSERRSTLGTLTPVQAAKGRLRVYIRALMHKR
ncbi:hypothetical protein [Pseudomonas sp. BN515]|uniref:hypothetical protein n=1 Tax=Pseudomonas sp. BN515 TaxID=2567892 RepID=UPI002455885F|nr:hypothetical protein [Pseudomonas sp. BN515]MDH4869811.1 hypothetical protein [Pseudomonas sp. BN515]